MASPVPYGPRSTANQVLAGVDLTRRWILVTGCDEEIGFETISASAAQRAARADPALQRSRRGLAVSRGCENRSALQSNPRRRAIYPAAISPGPHRLVAVVGLRG